ncbi:MULTISPECIES: carbonic anhydrase [Paraburkholderia]|uniref:carbonic anhydrase n=1 Tax=Paraburkholderia TaxID=1822464 RepID=UPI00225542A0|nr:MULTISPECIES: carbonic anhydrase [Paraburkholderia]MCX4159646.1 carbonic anhydrase [Paraburkholderia aspalathi]MDN7169044.1 carbonic anhydrase [Paraburkholderia sp. SECH2]MDQ6397531.1 carbonic anhydrase [Paraburkholderia aspalathi]
MSHHRASSASRRQLLLTGAASLTLTLAGVKSRSAHAESSTVVMEPGKISADEALSRLLAGNTRYVTNTPLPIDSAAARASVASAQHPIAAIVGCADSRVAPELIFDQGPGGLFVIRIAGNVASREGIASLEYGVKYLGIPLIMVLGHTNCGAVAAAVKVAQESTSLPGHLPELIQEIVPAVRTARTRGNAYLVANSIVENVRLNTHRLATSEPVLASEVKERRVKVVGAIYDLATGKVGLI